MFKRLRIKIIPVIHATTASRKAKREALTFIFGLGFVLVLEAGLIFAIKR